MATLDIRKQEKEVSTIKFDDSADKITRSNYNLMFNDISVCDFDDLDDFIAACMKAKELWHNK